MEADSGGLPCNQEALACEQGLELTPLAVKKDWTGEPLATRQEEAMEDGGNVAGLEKVSASITENVRACANKVTEGASTSRGQGDTGKKLLYSDMLKKNDERERYSVEYRRKNVVRLRFLGEQIPDRDFVAKRLLMESMRFTPLRVFALIHISGSREFEFSFRNGVYLEQFWDKFVQMQHNPVWKDFIAVRISQANLKTVTILFKNESVPSLDILYWLRKQCTVLGDLDPIYDRFGFWVGGYKVRVRLEATEYAIKHLPSIITIGRNRGFLFYAGQPKTCFKCGSKQHLSSYCPKLVCGKCGQQGHLSQNCEAEVLCNPCKNTGHFYLQCPRSARNYSPYEQTVEERMEMEAKDKFYDPDTPEPVTVPGGSRDASLEPLSAENLPQNEENRKNLLKLLF
uniref:CCHC-type domain-containing protein n=1 Tax=Latimeria chalumnae TaxID=7897 RepID=M3XLK8_LATCH